MGLERVFVTIAIEYVWSSLMDIKLEVRFIYFKIGSSLKFKCGLIIGKHIFKNGVPVNYIYIVYKISKLKICESYMY